MTTETRTYVGLTGTQAFDGFKGLRINARCIGVKVSSEEWGK